MKKVLAGLVNSTRDPLKKHNPTLENMKRSSQKKKKKKKTHIKLETRTQVFFSTIQMNTKGAPLPGA